MKILKDEYLFDLNGHHILSSNGFAIPSTEAGKCESSAEIVEKEKLNG